MRPYIVVIRDSFHAALASRVLWIAFVAIWLLLAALAPIGFREDLTTDFRGQRDIQNGTRMKAMLAQGLADPKLADKAIGRLAAAMPDELRDKLVSVGEGEEVRIRVNLFADALNACLDDESWYDQQVWEPTLRLKELRELDEVQDQELSDSMRRRRARLRIEAAMPGVFQTRAVRSISLTYAGLEFPANLAVDKTRFTTLINQWVVPVIIDWLLGFVLIFLGILVTASMIPDMLQPGSLHLLLSKPVTRTMLLLSKFLGGCAFVLLCVIQLVVGLYLVAGLRLDIWNIRLLWCIPVSVFLFSVFYSVSVLAGLRWRSPILAIGVTTIFGTGCLVVGIIGGVFDSFVTGPDRIQGMTVAGDVVFANTRGSGLARFDASSNQWVEVFESDAMSGDRVLKPVALDDDTIVTARVIGGRFNPFGSGVLDLLVLSSQYDWSPEPSLRLPTATSRLYLAGDTLIALNTSDLNQTDTTSVLDAAGEEVEEEGEKQEETGFAGGLLGKLSNMMGVATNGFEPVLPPGTSITPPRGIEVDPGGNVLYALTRGRLLRFSRQGENDPWKTTAEVMLEGDPSLRGVIAVAGTVLMVSRVEQPIVLFDCETLEPLNEVPLSEHLIPTSVLGLEAGRFLLLTSDGRFRLVSPSNTDRNAFSLSGPRGSSVEALCLNRKANLVYVAHHTDQLDLLDAQDLSVRDTVRPTLGWWRRVDKYVIGPLRMVIPQTGELGETISAMVSGKSAITFSQRGGEEQVERYNVFRPVVSCALFITIMLTINCIYFKTRDY